MGKGKKEKEKFSFMGERADRPSYRRLLHSLKSPEEYVSMPCKSEGGQRGWRHCISLSRI